MKYIFFIFLSIHCCQLSGQLLGLEAAWENQYDEWNIYAVDDSEEEIEGQLRMRWSMNNDWSVWDYRIGEYFGTIQVKWKGNFNQWEIRGGGEILDIQTIYKDDASQWRIRSGGQVYRLELNTRDVPYDWRVDNEDLGFYEVYSEWQGDPNRWLIKDELSDEVSIHTKMALLFFSVFSSTIE